MQQNVTFAAKDSQKTLLKKKLLKNQRPLPFYRYIQGVANSISYLRFNVPDEIPLVFHNESNCHCYFIIKQLENRFNRSVWLSWKNTEKHKTFSIPIEKEVRKIDKDCNESVVTISHKIKFIGSARFITSLLSNLVDSLTEGIHKIKCNDRGCFLKSESIKGNLIKHKCSSCNENYSNKIHK